MRQTVGNETRSGDLTVTGDLSATHAASHESGGGDELTLAQSQVTGLVSDLAGKAPLASPTFTGTVEAADIEVSGGVFLGGTAAANELDDYEEGTWTPTVADAASGGNTTTTGSGTYVKIGNAVTVHFNIENIDTTGLSAGILWIQGLPFTVGETQTTGYCGSVVLDNITFSASRTYVNVVAYEKAAACIFVQNGSGAFDTSLQVSAVSSGVSDIKIAAVTYFTA